MRRLKVWGVGLPVVAVLAGVLALPTAHADEPPAGLAGAWITVQVECVGEQVTVRWVLDAGPGLAPYAGLAADYGQRPVPAGRPVAGIANTPVAVQRVGRDVVRYSGTATGEHGGVFVRAVRTPDGSVHAAENATGNRAPEPGWRCPGSGFTETARLV